MLNVESASAVLLAVLVFGEDPGFREAGAAAANLLGVVLLPPVGEGGASDMVGAAAIAGACLSWTVDNNLTQRLSQRDPVTLARTKSLRAGVASLVLALVLRAASGIGSWG